MTDRQQVALEALRAAYERVKLFPEFLPDERARWLDLRKAVEAVLETAPTDVETYDRAKAAIEAGEDELIPADVVERMLAGESLLRVWREYRGMTQASLADASGVNRVQIAEIEGRRRTGSVGTLRKLADALRITVDDLI